MKSSGTKRIKHRTQASALMSILALCIMPVKATDLIIESNNTIDASSASIPQQNLEINSDQLISKLEQLQADVKKKSIAISLEEAIRLGVKNNPILEIAFEEIQDLEWQLIRAKRKWYPTFRVAGGSPFTGYTWSTFVENNYGQESVTSAIKGDTTPNTAQRKSKNYNTRASARISSRCCRASSMVWSKLRVQTPCGLAFSIGMASCPGFNARFFASCPV